MTMPAGADAAGHERMKNAPHIATIGEKRINFVRFGTAVGTAIDRPAGQGRGGDRRWDPGARIRISAFGCRSSLDPTRRSLCRMFHRLRKINPTTRDLL
jgi:hypothetical protein